MTTTAISVSSTTTSQTVVSVDFSCSSISLRNTDPNRAYLSKGSPAAVATAPYYLDENGTIDIDGADAKEAWYVIWTANGGGALVGEKTTTTALGGPGTTPILTLIQERVCPFIGVESPSVVFSGTDRTQVELKATVNKCARMIGRAYAWNKLKVQASYTGDGSTEDFDLPDDYHWMPDSARLWSSQTKYPLARIFDEDDWLGIDVQSITTALRSWTIFGGQIHFKPALESAEVIRHFYQSTALVEPASGTAKSAFTLDTDYFRLDEDLLALAIIYVWKMDHGNPYAEQMQDYETAKEKLIARDKGAKVLVQGTTRIPRGVTLAYPLSVPTS